MYNYLLHVRIHTYTLCIKSLPVYHRTRNVRKHLVTQVDPALAAGLEDLEN